MEFLFLGTLTYKTTHQPKPTPDNIPAPGNLMRSQPSLFSLESINEPPLPEFVKTRISSAENFEIPKLFCCETEKQ